MENSKRYQVHTHWGWFSLDEGAYADYLAGRLWICWEPGGKKEKPPEQAETPVHVSKEALRLRDAAEKRGVHTLLQELYPGRRVTLPLNEKIEGLSIEELCLSVRASNGLMRAGASTLGRVAALMQQEQGLKSVRNLGEKSEKEITHSFVTVAYSHFSGYEKAEFWQSLLDGQREGCSE